MAAPDSEVKCTLCQTVAQAARHGHYKEMMRLVKKGHSVGGMDNRGWRAIHEASHGNYVDCLTYLLQQGDTDVNSQSFDGKTALLTATEEGHIECMTLLLDHKANPNIPDAMDQYPILQAVKTSQEKCVQLLIDRGACVDSQLYCGTTALHQASAEGFKDIVKILLKAGAMVDITEEYNITPLFTAAQYGQAQCLKLILQHADPELMNKSADDGAVPLFLAAQEGHDACVEVLLEHGADANLMTHDNPALPLYAALQFNRLRCVELLLPKTDKCLFDRCEGSPFDFSLSHTDSTCTQLLLSHGVSPNYLHKIPSGDNYIPKVLRFSHAGSLFRRIVSPLTCVAITESNICHAEVLLNAGARTEPSLLEVPSLLPALDTGNFALAQLLITHGATVNIYHPYLCGNLTLVVCLRSWKGLNFVLRAGAEVRSMLEDNICLSSPTSQCTPSQCHISDDPDEEENPCTHHNLDVFSVPRIFTVARYSMHHSASISPVHILTRLLHYAGNISLNPKLHSLVTTEQEWKSLVDFTESPRSLTHYCRLIIRDYVGSKHLINPASLASLPIPATVLDYILFTELQES